MGERIRSPSPKQATRKAVLASSALIWLRKEPGESSPVPGKQAVSGLKQKAERSQSQHPSHKARKSARGGDYRKYRLRTRSHAASRIDHNDRPGRHRRVDPLRDGSDRRRIIRSQPDSASPVPPLYPAAERSSNGTSCIVKYRQFWRLRLSRSLAEQRVLRILARQ